jgi:crossover junction endodeoxyribonuclease RusA
MRSLVITVYGRPAPQGSKAVVGRDKKGRAILVESSKKVKPWREDVKAAALVAMGSPGNGISGPVKVQMIFTMAKPKSAPKRRRTWPDKYPDLSKLVRSTEDALTDVGAWEDDARVIELRTAKVFPGEDPRSLGVPGAVIRIESVEDI